MPARDHSLPLRRRVVEYLRAEGAGSLISRVADRIYGERPVTDPVWPFVMMGTPIPGPYAPSGQMGGRVNFTIHTFAKGPSADAAFVINAGIVESLDEKKLDLGAGIACIHLAFQSSQVIPDAGSPTDWHGLVSFTALTAELI